MSITREKLIELARAEAQERAAAGDVVSAYVIGSVATSEPLLGGAADVDLVMIHTYPPVTGREMVRLSADAHLDIAHHPRSMYAQPRLLRVHPWLGPAISDPVYIYDPEHFFEWVQAGTRGQFHRPDHACARARAFLDAARKSSAQVNQDGAWLPSYLRAVLEGANAAVCLAGAPAAGRRAALTLEQRASALDRPEVYGGFLRLLGTDRAGGWDVPAWLSSWGRAFDDVPPSSPDPLLVAFRRSYYLSGFQALAEASRPECLVWPLLTIWDRTLRSLQGASAAPHHHAWDSVLEQLGLSPTSRASRAGELDAYLEHIEAVVDEWAEKNGA